MEPARKLPHATLVEVSAPSSAVSRIETSDGSAAEIDAQEVLRVRDRSGAVLFEYDPESGQGRLIMGRGDLSLEAPHGDIRLMAGGEVRCVALGEVALHSGSAVSITSGKSGVRVDAQSTAVTSERFALAASEADLRVERTRFTGQWLDAGVERAELLLGKLESRVGTLIQRATNAFHFVEELHQLKTKRMRVRAEEGMNLDAGHVVMKAKEDVDIDGAQINLG